MTGLLDRKTRTPPAAMKSSITLPAGLIDALGRTPEAGGVVECFAERLLTEMLVDGQITPGIRKVGGLDGQGQIVWPGRMTAGSLSTPLTRS